MGAVYWLCTTLMLAVFLYLLLQELQWMIKRKRFPPGPKGLPILGSFHLLGKNPHHDLFRLSQKYGPVMYMRFGYVPAIIVSSPEAAEKFLKVHDLSFASRPYSEAAWHMAYGQRNLIFAPYGSYWRNMRKLCTLQLMDSFKQAASQRVAVDLSSAVSATISDMSSLMVFGKKYMNEEVKNRRFKDLIADVSHFSAVPNLGEYFPFLGALDLQGLTRRLKDLSKTLDDFIEKIISDHVQAQKQEKARDFVDTLMSILESGEAEFEFDHRHVKSVLLDIFITSFDTVSTSLDWAMAELLRHPNAMQKLQVEIQEKVGVERMVEESDLEGLEYLDAVIKETLRLHPAAPLLIPHEAIEDCPIDGFHIEQKSRIIVNIWAISHDPNVWPEPDRFHPERFLGSKIDLRGHDFQLIPFGSGRRICPGLQLALTVFRLVLAQLVHCFSWELPNAMLPRDIDMNEAFGLVTAKAKHILAVPNYRLHA